MLLLFPDSSAKTDSTTSIETSCGVDRALNHRRQVLPSRLSNVPSHIIRKRHYWDYNPDYGVGMEVWHCGLHHCLGCPHWNACLKSRLFCSRYSHLQMFTLESSRWHSSTWSLPPTWRPGCSSELLAFAWLYLGCRSIWSVTSRSLCVGF